MSASTTQTPTAPATHDRLTFTGYIPRLKHLLPQRRGVPGLTYYQIPTTKMREAQDRGLREVDGTMVYTIKGPGGEVDVKLYCSGKPIPGQSHLSGRRSLLVHRDIETATGIPIQPLGDLHAQESKSPRGDEARVRGGAQEKRPAGSVSAE